MANKKNDFEAVIEVAIGIALLVISIIPPICDLWNGRTPPKKKRR